MKMIRARKLNRNFTPVDVKTAEDNLEEEIVDVLSVLLVLGFDLEKLVEKAKKSPKFKRWAERLGYQE